MYEIQMTKLTEPDNFHLIVRKDGTDVAYGDVERYNLSLRPDIPSLYKMNIWLRLEKFIDIEEFFKSFAKAEPDTEIIDLKVDTVVNNDILEDTLDYYSEFYQDKEYNTKWLLNCEWEVPTTDIDQRAYSTLLFNFEHPEFKFDSIFKPVYASTDHPIPFGTDLSTTTTLTLKTPHTEEPISFYVDHVKGVLTIRDPMLIEYTNTKDLTDLLVSLATGVSKRGSSLRMTFDFSTYMENNEILNQIDEVLNSGEYEGVQIRRSAMFHKFLGKAVADHTKYEHFLLTHITDMVQTFYDNAWITDNDASMDLPAICLKHQWMYTDFHIENSLVFRHRYTDDPRLYSTTVNIGYSEDEYKKVQVHIVSKDDPELVETLLNYVGKLKLDMRNMSRWDVVGKFITDDRTLWSAHTQYYGEQTVDFYVRNDRISSDRIRINEKLLGGNAILYTNESGRPVWLEMDEENHQLKFFRDKIYPNIVVPAEFQYNGTALHLDISEVTYNSFTKNRSFIQMLALIHEQLHCTTHDVSFRPEVIILHIRKQHTAAIGSRLKDCLDKYGVKYTVCNNYN